MSLTMDNMQAQFEFKTITIVLWRSRYVFELQRLRSSNQPPHAGESQNSCKAGNDPKAKLASLCGRFSHGFKAPAELVACIFVCSRTCVTYLDLQTARNSCLDPELRSRVAVILLLGLPRSMRASITLYVGRVRHW